MWVEAYLAAVHTGCTYTLVTGGKAFIFMRKHCRYFPVRSKSFSFLSSQKGPAFFDEDDVCAGP